MSRCPRCRDGPRSPSLARPMTPREASSGSPADRSPVPGTRVALHRHNFAGARCASEISGGARLALDCNSAERVLRCVAIGRKNSLRWFRCRRSALYSLIESTKLNGVNPRHYLADVLAPSPAKRIDQLLPWNWRPADETRAAARTGAFTERLLCFPPRPRNSTSGSRNIACLSTREACCTLHPRMLMAAVVQVFGRRQ
jgi:hypothetical protein